MIIHQPEIIQDEGQALIYARIELRRPRPNFPEYLWIRVPQRFADRLCLQSDAFLVPGLIAAMRFGEDVEVRGTVSPKLAYHLEEYQQALKFRIPDAVTPVDIHYQRLEPLPSKPAGVGMTFSGGVDSLFTLWKHLPQNQPIPGAQVTHALFALGFDVMNKNKERYEYLVRRYQNALDEIDVTLIPVESNLLRLNQPRLSLIQFDGALLIGAALALGDLFGKFLVSSSVSYAFGMTWKRVRGVEDANAWINASDALMDPFLSTDTLSIHHYGSRDKRVAKIQAISDWEFAHKHLRVCPQHQLQGERLNCSECEKCLRTLIPIYVLGKTDRFTSFDKPLRSNWDALRWARKFKPPLLMGEEAMDFVKEQKPDLVPYLRLTILIGSLRYWLMKLISKPARKWLGRYGYFVDPLAQAGAFENEEVEEMIRKGMYSGLGERGRSGSLGFDHGDGALQ